MINEIYENISIKDTIKQNWDKSSKNYDQCPGHGIRTEQEKEAWKNLLTLAVGSDKQKILDVGTGTGAMALVLAEMGHDVTGIDLSDGMLNKAREKAKTANLHVEFRIGDAERLSFPDNTFDVVINRHLLWTLPDPEKAIKDWYRVLKSGGRVVILDGNFRNDSLYQKLWRYCISVPLILITERKNPFHQRYSKDLERQLPMRQRERPQADIDLFNNAGFRDIGVVNETVARTYSFLDHLKYGYWGGHFLIKGVKQ